MIAHSSVGEKSWSARLIVLYPSDLWTCKHRAGWPWPASYVKTRTKFGVRDARQHFVIHMRVTRCLFAFAIMLLIFVHGFVRPMLLPPDGMNPSADSVSAVLPRSSAAAATEAAAAAAVH